MGRNLLRLPDPTFTITTGVVVMARIYKRHILHPDTRSEYLPVGRQRLTLTEDGADDLFRFIAEALDLSEEAEPGSGAAEWTRDVRDALLQILHDINLQNEITAIDRDMWSNALSAALRAATDGRGCGC